MKIGIVGTGISGMVASYLLAPENEVVVFEADSRIGGHTHTVMVPTDDGEIPVDTGFITFNPEAYPNFTRLLGRLGVDSQATDMSFSVSCRTTGFEYGGATLNRFFAQRRNLLRPLVWRILRDCLRFNRESAHLLESDDGRTPLGRYLRSAGYSQGFLDCFLMPMGAAIWSSSPRAIQEFPVGFFVRFFQKHSFLSASNRPTWRTITGGSRQYVDKLTAPYRDRVRLAYPVREIRRHPGYVEVRGDGVAPERFDHLVIATHSNQALQMLADPSAPEREVLGAIPFQANRTVLHTDAALLPHERRARGSWNYHMPRQQNGRVSVTYDLTALQRLATAQRVCVSLNPTERIRPDAVVQTIAYEHPLFSPAAVAAQRRYDEVSGVQRTHYCGAYWGYGFHEDGVNSALRVAERFGRAL
jgi:predicted NAD/FAD-binding protein